jgi:hypothetical protein
MRCGKKDNEKMTPDAIVARITLQQLFDCSTSTSTGDDGHNIMLVQSSWNTIILSDLSTLSRIL